MPINFEVAYFTDPILEKEFQDRYDFWKEKLPSMPSHADWFDLEVFDRPIKEMSQCEVEVRLYDQRIQEDPHTFGKLDKIRNNTVNRLRQLRIQLGIDAKKIKDFTPKRKKPSSLVEALTDEDYIE